MIEFDHSIIDDKIKMMDMIDQQNVNHKVGIIKIESTNSNQFSQQVIQLMVDRYHNVYHIAVDDSSHQIDRKTH